MPGKCKGAKVVGKDFDCKLKRGENAIGSTRHGKESGSEWRGFGMV